MTSIEAVAGYLPETRVQVAEYLRRYGMREARITLHERFFGFSSIPLDPTAGLLDHLVRAVEALPAFETCRPRIRYVIQARSMPVVAPHPANPLREACARLGLERTHAFCLTQHACASGLLAVEVAGRMLEACGEPDALALLLTGEKAFTNAAKIITDTGVMGEATAAVLVSSSGERDRVLGYAARTHGKFYGGAWMGPEATADFHAEYPDHLAEVMTAAVEQADLDFGDVGLILPHNVNRMSWLRVLKSLGIRGTDRLYLDNLPSYGHCFGADAFLNLRSATADGRLRPGDRYLMTAVGLGATFSAMVFQH